MKRFIFFARVYFVVLCCLPLALAAQEVDSFPNYVVIGAFAHHKNAINFTGDANQHKFPARFEMNPNRNLYYVYVLSTPDRAYAIAEAVKLRAETKYFDTWVYSGPLGTLTLANGKTPQGVDINPLTGHQFQSPGSQNETALGPSLLPSLQEGGNRPDENSALSENTNPGVATTVATQRTEKNIGRRNRRAVRSANNAGQPGSQDPEQAATGLETATGEQAKNRINPGIDQSSLNTAQPLGVGSQSDNGSRQHADPSLARQNSAVGQGADGAQQVSIATASERSALKTATKSGIADNTETAARNNGELSSSPGKNQDTQNETTSATNSMVASADQQEPQTDGRNNASQHAGQEASLPAPGDQSSLRRNSSERLTGSDNATQPDAADGRVQTDAETQDVTHAPVDRSLNSIGSVVQGPPPKRMTTEPLKTEELADKGFYFHLFRADNANMIEGEVDAIDFVKSRKMATYPGNKPVTVKMLSGKLQHVSFLCQVFGYRKQQKEFDPNSPEQDLYLDDKGNIVVPFELIRLQKGDIAIMYNVFFFKDAAVMRPESRYEVGNLLALLEEYPTYKIMIHGHTNGNANGKIIRMETPGNFYSLSGTKQGFGSAKKLSEERASVIREFLISSGITQGRMQIKAWGGKKPIHDKHSVRAHENVRVEIEILPD